MNLRLTNLFLLTFLAMNCFSQDKSAVISGKILSYKNTVRNVHIINLTNKLGTVSNDFGEFEIKVTANDTLLVSSIQYEIIKLVITENTIKSKKIEIYLKPSVTILEEVFLHGLMGNLNLDMNSTPKDTLPKHNFVFKLSDLDKKLPPDTHGFLKAPNAQDLTDPIKMNGAGVAATIPDYHMIKVRKLKRELSQKKQFPIKIKKELGIDFFTNNLKIPKEKINHFLTYCEYRNIIEEYNNNNLLQVIEILQEESKSYDEIEH